MKNLALAAAGLLLALASASAVSFVANGNNLDVVFDAELSFEVTVAESSPLYGLIFEDVYTSSQPDAVVTSFTTSTMTLPSASSTTADPNGSGTASFMAGQLDPTDLGLLWEFSPSASVSVGDTVTVGAGTFTLNSFFDVGNFPDSPASTVEVWLISFNGQVESGSALATSVRVPLSTSVPDNGATLALLGLGVLGLFVVQQRKR
jgi:hypothetical protein